jgi:hypothetical protein
LIWINAQVRSNFHLGWVGERAGGMSDLEQSDRIAAGEAPVPEGVLREVPRGALALAALTDGLLVVAWLAVYAFVFLPRGAVS